MQYLIISILSNYELFLSKIYIRNIAIMEFCIPLSNLKIQKLAILFIQDKVLGQKKHK